MEILKTQDLGVKYGSHEALRHVSLSVSKGEYLCVLGDNGSGKTTLIKAVLGLVPFSGQVFLNVEKPRIAYLPQVHEIDRKFPATVGEVVLTGTLKPHGLPFYSRAQKEMAQSALSRAQIGHLSKNRVSNLSGGQLQRVMLARALCRDPQLLVLDEPDAGLDPGMTESLYQILDELNALGITVMVVSHDIHEMEHRARRVVVLNRTVVFDGDVQAFAARKEEGLF